MKQNEELYNMVFIHFYPNIQAVDEFYNIVYNTTQNKQKFVLNDLNIQPNFKPNKQSRRVWTEEEKLEIEQFFREKEAKKTN